MLADVKPIKPLIVLIIRAWSEGKGERAKTEHRADSTIQCELDAQTYTIQLIVLYTSDILKLLECY